MKRPPNNIIGYPVAILVWLTRATNLASKHHMTISQAVQGALMAFCGLLSCTSGWRSISGSTPHPLAYRAWLIAYANAIGSLRKIDVRHSNSLSLLNPLGQYPQRPQGEIAPTLGAAAARATRRVWWRRRSPGARTTRLAKRRFAELLSCGYGWAETQAAPHSDVIRTWILVATRIVRCGGH